MAKTFLEITDLPTDQYNALHRLRPLLVSIFNSSRTAPTKMKLFKATLKFLYNKVVEFEKNQEKSQEASTKAPVTIDAPLKPIAKQSVADAPKTSKTAK